MTTGTADKPRRLENIVIRLCFQKPYVVGDYLCLRHGHGHPEFCRIRQDGANLYYCGGVTVVRLSEIENSAKWSAPLELEFV